MPETSPTHVPRVGRPRATSGRELELIALRLFAEHGYEATSVEMIATEAGTSRRTFFRYFDSKAAVLWREFDTEVAKLREALAGMPDDVPVMEAIRRAVISVNHYAAADVPELRARMGLIAGTPELAASAAPHYDAWERAVSDYAAARCGIASDSLAALAVGRATLAAARAAFDSWTARADSNLTTYLDVAIRALASGFTDDTLVDDPTVP